MRFSKTAHVVGLSILGLHNHGTAAAPATSAASHKTAEEGGKQGAVSSESALCSDIGASMIRKGGNAADAMVATVFCTGVVGMYHSGIGGGGFMLIRSPEGTYEYVDFRESAPKAMNETVYVGNVQGSLTSGLASGVPGEIRGMEYLINNYGNLSWKEVIMPAVKVARDGFPVTEDLVRYIQSATAGSNGNFLKDDPNWALDFAPNGKVVALGDTLTRKRYANTLETIANQGAQAFYTGDIAKTMIKALRADNGTMTEADLADYTVEVREPASISYRGYTLHATSAPSSGAVALSALKIFEGYEDVASFNALNLSSHRLVEAWRFAYGQRTLLGDPSYIPDLDTYQASMLSDKVTSEIRSRITDDRTHPVSYYDPKGIEILDTPGTSHVVTADSSGLAISLTTTINLLFGSKLVIPETGIIMNNEMNDFSIPGQNNAFGFAPSPNNYVRPGARPLSSISPIIADDKDGNLVLVTGAAGGSRIITATTLQVWNVLDKGMTAQQALAEKRLHDQLVPDVTWMEVGSSRETEAFLRSRGHNVTLGDVASSSSAQSIKVNRVQGVDQFEAGSEPRQKNSGGVVVQ